VTGGYVGPRRDIRKVRFGVLFVAVALLLILVGLASSAGASDNPSLNLEVPGKEASGDSLLRRMGSAHGAFCTEPDLPIEGAQSAFEVRLAKDRDRTRLGGQIRIRVENLGTGNVRFGHSYRLQRYEQGSWREVPVGPFFGSLLYARGEAAGPCQEVRVMSGWSAGVYRASKQVWPAASPRSKAVTVRVTFRVR
jgi:hypothetical protein